MQQNDLMKSLVGAFLYLAPQEGLYPTYISNITLMRVDHSTQPVAVLQEPSIVLVIQGVKRGYIGKKLFSFNKASVYSSRLLFLLTAIHGLKMNRCWQLRLNLNHK